MTCCENGGTEGGGGASRGGGCAHVSPQPDLLSFTALFCGKVTHKFISISKTPANGEMTERSSLTVETAEFCARVRPTGIM